MLAQACALGVVQVRKVNAINQHPARGGLGKPTQQVEQRGFAGARGADDGNKFAGIDLEADAAHGGDFKLAGGIDLGQVVGQDNGLVRIGLHKSHCKGCGAYAPGAGPQSTGNALK